MIPDLDVRCYKMHFSPTHRIGLKGEAYRSYFRTFLIFLVGGTKVHFVTPDLDAAPREREPPPHRVLGEE